MDINELKQKKAALIKEMRSIVDSAEERGEALSAEDQAKYERLEKDVFSKADQIKKEESLRELERNSAKIDSDPNKPAGGDPPQKEERDLFYRDKDKAENYFRDFLRYKETGQVEHDLRALQVDSDTAGGYIVSPQQFVNQLIKDKDNMVFMRRMSRTFSVPKAESLGFPSLDSDPADPTWTAELSIGNEDTSMKFGKRELVPHPLAQFIKVSNTLLRKAIQGPETIVRERLAYKSSVVEENAFLNGSGAGQPLGIFTASSNGISTSRDVSTGNTTTQMRFDGLMNCKMSMEKQYRQNCVWIFHRDAIKQLMKLKDGEGRYIWEAGITNNQPDRLLGYPIEESEYAPNTFTTGLYVGIIADLNYYWIADALGMTFQKLVELYAAANQTGYIIRSETDGMPVLEKAFARVKLA